ncbi:unnamed protein product [Arctia plantaginis]|uniref:PPPDE domain-containing protein n=1 Tax=Arctia plantaginis TaxID=874455 RepID=A0A8S1A1A9_ARCPL|nr:unnamed protein product [Arctia plantaginis]
MASEQGTVVELYIYDLTNGLASVLSPSILGRQIEGVWHTAIVAYQREFFYGGGGITSCSPGSTQLGQPLRIERLGETFVPFQLFVEYLQALATTTYAPAAYNLLEHNCNHFSDEVAQFLCGARVPKHIVAQPDELLAPHARSALQSLLDNLAPQADRTMYSAESARAQRQDSPDYLTLNTQIEEARAAAQELGARRSTLAEKLARKERRRDKKRKKHLRENGDGAADGECTLSLLLTRGGAGGILAASACSSTPPPPLPPPPDMAEAVETASAVGPEELSRAGPSSDSLAVEADERRQEELRKRSRDPPIVYTDIDGVSEFEKLAKSLENVELTPEERQNLDELQQYLVQGEGSWVLGDDFLAFIGRLLNDPSLASDVRVHTLRALSACALRDDVSLVLHQDRRHHALLNYAHAVDALPLHEQQALALFMCNLFENISSSEWLLYISEWEHNGQPLSNIRATTKVCVHSALSQDGELRELGTALMHNIATKEVKTVVFDEVCVELAMALLQLLQWAPSEEHLFRSVKALARFVAHSADVPQLVAMVGPDPQAFRGTSPRVDEQIDLIVKKIK